MVAQSVDNKGVGVAHEIKLPENQLHFSQTTEGAVLVRPKPAFRSIRNALNYNFKIYI